MLLVLDDNKEEDYSSRNSLILCDIVTSKCTKYCDV